MEAFFFMKHFNSCLKAASRFDTFDHLHTNEENHLQ